MERKDIRDLARRALYLAACATPPIEQGNPLAILLSQVHESDIPWPDHDGVARIDYVRGRPVITSATIVGNSIEISGGYHSSSWRNTYANGGELIDAAIRSMNDP